MDQRLTLLPYFLALNFIKFYCIRFLGHTAKNLDEKRSQASVKHKVLKELMHLQDLARISYYRLAFINEGFRI